VSSGIGVADAEEALDRLRRERIVYEPTPGFFRAVDLTP
jgi:hypothetical protein